MLPLSEFKVIEFCHVAAGPFCGMLLADMGADLVKVESPAGDTLRQWPPITEGFSENFASLNRNKRSVALDLKAPEDLAVARALILSADAVIENNRAGVMDRLGLGYEALKDEHPGLVFCSISAFGQTGPRAQEGGFDVTVQALSGIMSVTGEEGGGPVKCGVPVSDFTAGLYAAFATAAMLHRARVTGEGGNVDISMLGSSLAIGALQTSEYFGTGRDPKKLGSAHPRNAPYQAFACQDGHVVIAAGNDKLWRSAAKVMGMEEAVDDPRFASTLLRAQNQRALAGLVEARLAHFPRARILAELAAVGVPCAPISAYSEALADAQVVHAGWVEDLELPSGARTRTFGTPVVINSQREKVRMPAPALGAHNDQVLAELRAKQARRNDGGSVRGQERGGAMAEGEGAPVLLEHRGGSAILTLNRPESGNSLSAELVDALDSALDRALAHGAQLVVFKGAGRHLCTGFGLSGIEEQSDGDLLLRFVRIEKLLQKIAALPALTLCFGSGRTIGAGADLFAACDLRVATAAARFSFPGVGFGIILGNRRLAGLVGANAARDILMSGRVLSAEEALAAGLATSVSQTEADAAAAIAAAEALCERLTSETVAALRAATASPDDDADLAALVTAAARPGLRARILAHRERVLNAAAR